VTTTIPPRTADRAVPDAPAAPEGPEIRRSTGARTRADVTVLIGAAAAALSLAGLLVSRMIPSANLIAFVVIAYLLFLVLYGVLVSLEHDRRTVADRLGSVLMHSLTVVALVALLFVVGFTFWRGRWTHSPSAASCTPRSERSSRSRSRCCSSCRWDWPARCTSTRPGGRWFGSFAPWSRR
jgi:hypothetical protein